MPNLNPFLSKLVVDAAHLPVVSSDGVSFSSRTSAHEMFGGNASLCFFSKICLVAHVHYCVSMISMCLCCCAGLLLSCLLACLPS